MSEHNFGIDGELNEKDYAEDLLDLADEADNGSTGTSIKHVNVQYGYIIFEGFHYNYNGFFKLALEHGFAVCAVYDPEMHNGEIALYFKPLNKEMVEREVVETREVVKTIEEEQYIFDY